jgi:hypothetical protein
MEHEGRMNPRSIITGLLFRLIYFINPEFKRKQEELNELIRTERIKMLSPKFKIPDRKRGQNANE